jgi:hypothetical protein
MIQSGLMPRSCARDCAGAESHCGEGAERRSG